jgi:signal peptidase II
MMSERRAGTPLWGPFVGLVAAIVIADQATKAWISRELSGGRVIEFLGGGLRLVFSENDGALFGMFRGHVAIFALVSLGVIALIAVIHARSGRSPYMTLTLGLLLGGAIGNAIDRFRLGYVVDFVDGGIGSLRFFTFNLGDACISTALVLLIALAIWPRLNELGRPPEDRRGEASDGAGHGPTTIASNDRASDA